MMKKILFLVAFTAMTATAANAQWNLNYQGDVELGYSIGVGTFDFDRVNIHTSHGIRFNEYLFVGAGTGLDIYTGGGEAGVALPLYLDVKGYLPVAPKLNLFAGVDLGGHIGLSDNVNGGFLLSPQVGLAYKILDGKALTFSFGYDHRTWTASSGGFRASINVDAISLKLGFQF